MRNEVILCPTLGRNLLEECLRTSGDDVQS